MNFGLSRSDQSLVQKVLQEFPEVEEAVIFGSRAMGHFKKASDVDLVLKGPMTLSTASRIRSRLEEDLPLPYFFDILCYPDIGNPDLKEHIDRHGRVFYRKKA